MKREDFLAGKDPEIKLGQIWQALDERDWGNGQGKQPWRIQTIIQHPLSGKWTCYIQMVNVMVYNGIHFPNLEFSKEEILKHFQFVQDVYSQPQIRPLGNPNQIIPIGDLTYPENGFYTTQHVHATGPIAQVPANISGISVSAPPVYMGVYVAMPLQTGVYRDEGGHTVADSLLQFPTNRILHGDGIAQVEASNGLVGSYPLGN